MKKTIIVGVLLVGLFLWCLCVMEWGALPLLLLIAVLLIGAG